MVPNPDLYASSRLGSGYKHKFWQIYGKKIILSTKNAKYFFSDYRKGLQWSRGCLRNIKFLSFFPVREGHFGFLDLDPNSGFGPEFWIWTRILDMMRSIKLHPETLNLRNLKIMPRNPNEIVHLWIRLQYLLILRNSPLLVLGPEGPDSKKLMQFLKL